MSVVHIVQLSLKPEVTPDKAKEYVKKSLQLQQDCKKDGKQYITTASAGRREFSLGFKEGEEPQYAFVFTFESIADRDYFLKQDKAHDDFFAYAEPLVKSVSVFDYTKDDY